VAIDLLLGCRELRSIVCVGAAIAIPSDARDKNQEFQAIPAGNPEIEKRRRGALRPRASRWRTAMADDVIYTEPVHTQRADTAISANDQETDWSGWERWMRGHLDIERKTILEAVVEVVGELEAKRDRQVRELELKIAECIGRRQRAPYRQELARASHLQRRCQVRTTRYCRSQRLLVHCARGQSGRMSWGGLAVVGVGRPTWRAGLCRSLRRARRAR
jgi:hypothetical protein